MQYLLIIYEDATEREGMSEAESAEVTPAYRTFTGEIVATGNFRAGDALEPTTTATTIRIRRGQRLVTDGPFAETKEHLVGYYLIEAADLDEAIGIAARIPSARFGAVEVRPVRKVS